MRVDISKYTEYIPEWNGNLDLPEGEQVKAKWRNLSKAERNKFTKTKDQDLVIRGLNKSNEEIDDEVMSQSELHLKVSTDEDALLKASEITFENLEDAQGNGLDTWEKVLAAPGKIFDSLIEEISGKIREKHLPDGELIKN